MSAAHQEFTRKYFHAIDDLLDAKAFASLFHEDATFTVGNFPTSVGREQIQTSTQQTFSAIKGVKHQTIRLFSVDEKTFVWEGTVTYTMPDDTVLAPIPSASVAELYPGNLSELLAVRVYADLSPFMAAMATK